MEATALFSIAAPSALTVTLTPPKHRRRTPPRKKPDVDHVAAWKEQNRRARRLDLETKTEKRHGPPEIAIATERELNFRHGHWRARRDRLIAHLGNAGTPWHTLERFKHCGANCRVQWSEIKRKRRLRASYCRCRHCEPCMRAKANLIAANLARRLGDRPKGRYRFLTLTLKHTNAPLIDQVKRIITSFKKLRATSWWKRRGAGGCFTLEVKHNGTHWHPHLHIIDEGGYVPFKELSDLWLKITGDSSVVDVRRIDSGKDAAHYVTKYVTKGTSPSVWESNDLAQEWIAASKGVRVCATYGSWRGFALTHVTDTANDWQDEISLDELLRRAANGEEHAMLIRNLLIPAATDPEVCSQAR